jgi:hypothetical protein
VALILVWMLLSQVCLIIARLGESSLRAFSLHCGCDYWHVRYLDVRSFEYRDSHVRVFLEVWCAFVPLRARSTRLRQPERAQVCAAAALRLSCAVVAAAVLVRDHGRVRRSGQLRDLASDDDEHRGRWCPIGTGSCRSCSRSCGWADRPSQQLCTSSSCSRSGARVR